MKKFNRSTLTLLVLAGLFVACGREDSSQSDTNDSQASVNAEANTSNAPVSTSSETPLSEVTIRANDQTQYDLREFTVAAGTEVKLTLIHTGNMPKAAMGHNVVILTMDADPDAFANSARQYTNNGYIPPEMEDLIIVHTEMLGGGESDTITFTAPEEPGNRSFLCSFPGHYQLGMKGTMHVQ